MVSLPLVSSAARQLSSAMIVAVLPVSASFREVEQLGQAVSQ